MGAHKHKKNKIWKEDSDGMAYAILIPFIFSLLLSIFFILFIYIVYDVIIQKVQ